MDKLNLFPIKIITFFQRVKLLHLPDSYTYTFNISRANFYVHYKNVGKIPLFYREDILSSLTCFLFIITQHNPKWCVIWYIVNYIEVLLYDLNKS